MTKATYNTMGLDVAFSVPSSVEEFDQNAKKAGACLESAIDNTIYRGSLAVFRDRFLHGCDADAATNRKKIDGVEQVTGVKRNTKTVTLKSKNEDGSAKTSETWDETEVEYFQRVLAKKQLTKESFQDLANTVAASIAFDASARPAGVAGPKKIGKLFLDAATAPEAAGKLPALAEKLSKKLKREVPVTVEAVAVAIKEFQDLQTAAMLA